MDSQACRPGWTRWAAVFVLLGMFLMHGAPSSAGGCHGAMPAAVPMSHAAATTSMVAAHTPTPGLGPSAHGAAQAAVSSMGGALCVSTPVPRGVTLPAVLLLAVLAVTVYTLPRAPWTVARRPGSPRGGRHLLLQVGVART